MAITAAQERLEALLPKWHDLLRQWSAEGSLGSAAQEALLLNGIPASLEALINQWSGGDFRSLPPVVLLSAADISGAMGAYAISTGRIYLNAEWMAGASKEQVYAVLTEELGHHLDGLLNAVDTPGDEGERFTKSLIAEQALGQKSESTTLVEDSGFISISKQLVYGEFASDNSAPTLNSINLGYSEQEKIFNIAVLAKDNLSGVAFVGAAIESATNSHANQQIDLKYDTQTGKWLGEFSIGSDAPSGEYILRRVYLMDTVGNTVNYGNNWGVLLSTVPVTGSLVNPNLPTTTDITPPAIKKLDQYYDSATNSLRIKVDITDGGSGVGEARARIISLLSPSNCYDIGLTIGNDGQYNGVVELNQNSPSGTWVVNRLYAIDKARNYANNGGNWTTTPVSVSTQGAMITPKTLQTDEIQPVLKSIKLETNLLDREFKIGAEIIENGSEVVFAQAWIRSKDSAFNRQVIDLYFNKSTGLWEGLYKLQPQGPSGGWSIERFMIRDGANNFKDYPNSEIPGSESLQAVKITESTVGSTPTIRGNSLYTIVDGPSWTQAEANAVKLGGHLATINDFSENTFAEELIFQASVHTLEGGVSGWIGLNDNDSNGTFTWSSGDSVTYRNWDTRNFQPNYAPQIVVGIISGDYRDRSSDSHGRTAGTWHDYEPNEPARPLVGVSETPFIRRGDSAYVIVQGPTWEEAEANAVKLGGHLVTINDAAENDFITNIIKLENDLSFFIGATDKQNEGVWTDALGTPLSFTNWDTWSNGKEPNGGTSENYGVIYPPSSFTGWSRASGKWNDTPNVTQTTKGVAEIKLTPNNNPTGTPSITGTLKVGSMLTIDASAIKDVDNFTGYTPTYKYSWESSTDGNTWTALTSIDATDGNSTYTLTTAEVGKKIRGLVSYVDGYGTNETLPTPESSTIESLSVNKSSGFSLSSTFGVNGILRINYGESSGLDEWSKDLVVDDHGNIYITGIASSGTFALKLDKNGVNDKSFGSNGWSFFDADKSARPGWIELFLDKILIAGDSGGKLAAYSLTSSGSLISKSSIDRGAYESISGGYFNPGNNTIFTSGFVDSINHGFTSWLVNDSGALQPNKSFGIEGKSTIDLGAFDYLSAFANDSTGNLYAGGQSRFPDNNTGIETWSIASATSSGDLNTKFSPKGFIKKNPTGVSRGTIDALGINKKNELIVIGAVKRDLRPSLELCVQRYTLEGGLISESFIDSNVLPPSSFQNATNLSPTIDGGFIFAYTGTNPDNSTDIVVAKLNENGEPENAFGESGFYQLKIEGNQSLYSSGVMAVDKLGNSILAFRDAETHQMTLVKFDLINPLNTPPSGTPTLSGNTKVGQTITIDKTAIQDADNFSGYTPTYNYNWEVSTDGNTWTKLTTTDATDNNTTYTLTTSEVGKKVRGVVSYLDGYGTQESVASTASAPITSSAPPSQILTLTPPSKTSIRPGITTTSAIAYNVSTGEKSLTGIGASLYFDSTQLSVNTQGDPFQKGLLGNAITADTSNADGDLKTDKVLSLTYADFGGDFPGSGTTLPLTLANLNLVPTASYTGTTLHLKGSPATGFTATGADLTLGYNAAPVVSSTPLPIRTTNRGSAFSYTLPSNLFSDADSTLTLSASTATGAALPAWLTFNPSTRTFSGTPTSGGTLNLAVSAADELGSVSAPLTLKVREVQALSSSAAPIRYKRNKDVVVPINYSTTDASASTGLAFKVHFNSSLFSFDPTTGVSNKAQADVFQVGAVQLDTADTDNDPTTDRYIPINIASFSGQFPSAAAPTKLADLIFRAADRAIDPVTGLKDTSINFSETEAAQGYGFAGTSASLKPLSFSLDVDGDGKVTALGDGLMVIRHLFGAAFSGVALTDKAISPDSPLLGGKLYTSMSSSEKASVAAQVAANIQQGVDSGLLDVDKDNKTTALGDGLMVIRRLFGAAFDGAALTNKAISPDSPYFGPPADFAAVAANIDALKPTMPVS